MATLILGSVGRVVAGRTGAAIGAIAGQLIDQSLFGPPPRQGPRLADLAVQSSTYGAAIPKLFGRTRVAGSVIWSTDLIETTRRQSNGKGRAATETYSYSASFAVLLSARCILRVERIWADGKLLRGNAGDFKTELAALRVHTGDPDQVPDPLIASAEGADATAWRGSAYAVLEGLQLADYGNRIPSLSFEVVADEVPVPVGQILQSLGEVRADDGPGVSGCAASGDSLRGFAEGIATAIPMHVGDDGGARVAFTPAVVDGPAPNDLGTAADESHPPRIARQTDALDAVPSVLSVAYADPERAYQAGLQRAARNGSGHRDMRIDLPFVLDAGDAARLAADALARLGISRTRATIALPWRAMRLRPGNAITVGAESWCITEMRFERMVVQLDLVRVGSNSTPAIEAGPGRATAESDAPAGSTVLAVIDLPPLSDTAATRPAVAVFANGTSPGWRRAALLASIDGGATYVAAGSTAAPATIGETLDLLPPAPAELIDRVNSVHVRLLRADMLLADADVPTLLAGANRAMIGSEAIQFGRAVPLGGGIWRLSDLWRGRRGTEDGIATHAIGNRFVLLDPDAAAYLPADVSTPGVMVMAAGVGDSTPFPIASAATANCAVLPLLPAHPACRTLINGDVEISWVRRSRAGWPWVDGVDAPLAEEREAWRLTRTVGATVTSVELSEPRWTYTAGARAGDLASGATAAAFAIVQLGTFGASPPVTLNLTL